MIDEGEPNNSTSKTLAKIDKNQTIDSKTQPLQSNPIQGDNLERTRRGLVNAY